MLGLQSHGAVQTDAKNQDVESDDVDEELTGLGGLTTGADRNEGGPDDELELTDGLEFKHLILALSEVPLVAKRGSSWTPLPPEISIFIFFINYNFGLKAFIIFNFSYLALNLTLTFVIIILYSLE